MRSIRQLVGSGFRGMVANTTAFNVLRTEAQSLMQRASNQLNPSYWRKLRTLNSRSDLSLNLGCAGEGLAGWVNVDLFSQNSVDFALDVRRRLPFASGRFNRIFAEHVLEHIDFRDNVESFLKECFRLLSPGGCLRIVVPDGRRYVQAYLSGDREAWRTLGWDLDSMPDDIYTPMHIINHVFHQDGEHLFAYDFETLEFALRRAGFSTVVEQTYGQSVDPELALDRQAHAGYSLYVDAVK